MKKNKIIILAVILVVLVAVVAVYLNRVARVPSGNYQGQQNNNLPKATGDIDATINALLEGASDEDSAVGDALADKNLIISDKAEISDFGQSANVDGF